MQILIPATIPSAYNIKIVAKGAVNSTPGQSFLLLHELLVYLLLLAKLAAFVCRSSHCFSRMFLSSFFHSCNFLYCSSHIFP